MPTRIPSPMATQLRAYLLSPLQKVDRLPPEPLALGISLFWQKGRRVKLTNIALRVNPLKLRDAEIHYEGVPLWESRPPAVLIYLMQNEQNLFGSDRAHSLEQENSAPWKRRLVKVDLGHQSSTTFQCCFFYKNLKLIRMWVFPWLPIASLQ